MASLMTLEVLTPDQYLMKRKDIAYVLLNTVTGGIGILANHGPLIAVLGEGTLKLQDGNNHVILLYVEGGFAEVNGKPNENQLSAACFARGGQPQWILSARWLQARWVN